MELLPNETKNPDLYQLRYFMISGNGGQERASKYDENFNLSFVAWDDRVSIPLTTNEDITSKTLNTWESGNFYPYPDEQELEREIDNACEYVWSEYYDTQFDTVLNNNFYPQYSGTAYYDEESFINAKNEYERLIKSIAKSTINEWLYYYNFDEEEYQ